MTLQNNTTSQQEHLYFYVGSKCFALPIEYIDEVVDKTHITPLPGAPCHVAGVANVRGEILTVFDISQGSSSSSGVNLFVVLKYGLQKAVLCVGQVGKITAMNLLEQDDHDITTDGLDRETKDETVEVFKIDSIFGEVY